jgi:hypothetical protein
MDRLASRPPVNASLSCTKPCAKGAGVEDLHEKTHIKPWFIEQMKELVELEEKILASKAAACRMIC